MNLPTLVLLTTLLYVGCTSVNSSISSEDLRQMKEQSEYLLKIDSANCTPYLVRLLKMESCYKMVRLNQKYRNHKIVFDTVRLVSFMTSRVINGIRLNSGDVNVTNYYILYRIQDGEQVLKNKLSFTFRRDTITQTLYCYRVGEGYDRPRNSMPIDHFMNDAQLDE